MSPDEQHGFGVQYWEIIADNLSRSGWSLGYVSAIDSKGRTIWIADAHRGDGERYVVRGDEKLTAFLELERQLLKDAKSWPCDESQKKRRSHC